MCRFELENDDNSSFNKTETIKYWDLLVLEKDFFHLHGDYKSKLIYRSIKTSGLLLIKWNCNEKLWMIRHIKLYVFLYDKLNAHRKRKSWWVDTSSPLSPCFRLVRTWSLTNTTETLSGSSW